VASRRGPQRPRLAKAGHQEARDHGRGHDDEGEGFRQLGEKAMHQPGITQEAQGEDRGERGHEERRALQGEAGQEEDRED
jgi:hypothetical protein